MELPIWILAIVVAGVLVGVALIALKRIRRHERKDSDAPDLILTEDGRLSTVLPRKEDKKRRPPE